MKLLRYRVTNFRSVVDSDWIDAEDVTSLIGVNESGKTNLLLPLWKLNPAHDGELQPTSDYPKTNFGAIRADPETFVFIRALFETLPAERVKLAELAGVDEDQVRHVEIARRFDNKFEVTFPNERRVRHVEPERVSTLIDSLKNDAQASTPLKTEEGLRQALVSKVDDLLGAMRTLTAVDGKRLKGVRAELSGLIPEVPAKTSTLVPRVGQTLESLDALLAEVSAETPTDVEDVRELALQLMPTFVYYSNYGNLDSEIYLPHVVANLARTDLGSKESAKARTLRVLFKFVQLQPKEVLELGQDFKAADGREPTQAEIAVIAEKKRTRSILLQSAGATLTSRFGDWWKQGDYRFRFEADGNHFRIWVADSRRPEEIELESRSTGLQWFLSFYLVFLVESEGAHEDAILLLDEPGLSLHPLAQRDLSAFFEGLSTTNQLIYTTHSPFLVDADRLDRVRKIYVDASGKTKASPNLRQSAAEDAQPGASYAVYSALNLSVSESLLLGCTPIVVEGPSDQHYLTMMKVMLIGGGKISPKRELVFPPGGGTKTLRVTAAILTGRDDKLPVVLLDSDAMGKRMTRELETSLYAEQKQKLLGTDSYARVSGSELEDLIPRPLITEAVDRLFRGDPPFADITDSGPIVPLIEAWAKSSGVELEKGWKVDIAKRVKQRALTQSLVDQPADLVEAWTRMFKDFDRLD